MFVVLNPLAGGGRAEKKWGSIKSKLPIPYALVTLEAASKLRYPLLEAFRHGYRLFTAAGGDGTMNLLTQTVIDTFSENELQEISLGAIGLGTSNDFHKPFDKMIGSFPCRLDFAKKQKRDLLELTLNSANNHQKRRYCLLNASCGITAKANSDFNRPGAILKLLKKYCPAFSILFAVMKSVLTFQNIPLTIMSKPYLITNIGIVKSPFFSGNFAYECQFPADGSFNAYICHSMSLWEALKTLFNLRNHCFIEGHKSHRITIDPNGSLEIDSNCPIPFEFDGEVEWVQSVQIKILKTNLCFCT
jgi:diacylglycerol kinase family enzyme